MCLFTKLHYYVDEVVFVFGIQNSLLFVEIFNTTGVDNPCPYRICKKKK